ncbi:MAG TPA: DEAD/DEAH box helicase [Gemmataceae bacterium]|nr:DEAD/DEAH box helicase [Gemmataceae bacterium]
MNPYDPLELFLPPVQQWFRSALGTPTEAQRLGWPAIAAGQNTLILAPTGSGKTLAAFLACLDALWRKDTLPAGVSVLYVSPLKALNNDIHRNLQVPLQGVDEAARRTGLTLPAIAVGVRTGDTPAAERQRMARCPPQVLITTPESLHLLLTSRARETLRGVTHCIVDEIHALCANKRGVFLALLLERLAALTGRGFVRIGLSATQRPLEEVARYLGGSAESGDGEFVPRPVTVVDAGLRKDLDLRVLSPVERFGALPEKSIWPSVYRLLEREVRQHKSTIVFANNRRTVERITAQLNGQEPGSADGPPLARAHHGSVALEVRQETERALKEGRLPAVVATASLELGIDMGAVDLVCQVESPGQVARGLQRVGRAGHLVGRKSKGRLIPKTTADLLEQAVLAREMAAGRVEEIRVPINCLDVLAQQVVAAVAIDSWEAPRLYALVRRAYPYRHLSPQAFEGILEMVSGRYRFSAGEHAGLAPGALQPRVSWDRVHNRLLSLPGSQQLALVSGGTIPDTGQYAAYTRDGTRIGELDEEFIYERRVGDAFLLGTNAWRLERIETDRVIVSPAEGAPALVPFWRGEQAGRSYDLGKAIGGFLRDWGRRSSEPDCQSWLEQEHFLDLDSARNLQGYLTRQLTVAGCLPTDRTLVVEACRDPLGDWQIMVLSPLGNRLHLALRLALEARLRGRLGYRPQCLHHNDGILIRLADTASPPMDLFEGLTPDNVEALILEELMDSALFALRFRQNAARALLLPRTKPGKRAPLWLQRLRGRDLLQIARRHPDFPIMAETLRECLHDHLDLPRLQELLADIREGRVEIKTRRAEAPSPFAAGLLFDFTAAFMYERDRTDNQVERPAALDRQLLEQLVAPGRQGHLLDPRAIHQVERRLRGLGQPPRTATEMSEWLRRLGDLAAGELEGPMAGFLEELEADGRAKRLELPRCREPRRWVLAEEEEQYRQAFGLVPPPGPDPAAARAAAEAILQRFLQTHALVGLRDVLDRYPFEPEGARRQLEEWARMGRAVIVSAESDNEPLRWSAPANLEQVQRASLAVLRREVVTCPPQQFAHFVLRWQGLPAPAVQSGPDSLAEVLRRLEGVALPAGLWEQAVLPGRVPGYEPRWLDDWTASGEWTWVCHGDTETGPGQLTFWDRDNLRHLPATNQGPPPDGDAERVVECLHRHGAAFVGDLARDTRLAPSAVRSALWRLLRRQVVTNDQFDVVRRGEDPSHEPAHQGLGLRHMAVSPRRRGGGRQAEGRWALVPWGPPDAEAHAVFCARLLLRRYGVAARELADLDPAMPSWRVLYEVLSRMELAGEIRRGYLVQGLSGAQFALAEAIQGLQDLALPSSAAAPVVLLNSLDPANLYGSGAAFDIPLLDGGSRPLLRRSANWLVFRAGRPVLILENQGKRLTALTSASRDDLAAAVACLPDMVRRDRGIRARPRLTVEEWNGRPVTATEGGDLLQGAGFVRDYQSMTLYPAWR